MGKLKLVLLAMVMISSVVLPLNGCVKPEPEIVCEESLGVILAMNVIPTSFNETARLRAEQLPVATYILFHYSFFVICFLFSKWKNISIPCQTMQKKKSIIIAKL